jgi:hypothetical protein
MNTFRIRPGMAALGAVLLLGVAACDDDEEIEILTPIEDVVVTVRDANYNFQAAQTFSIADSIVHIAPGNGTILALSREHDDEILQAVRQNLIARGYEPNVDPGRVQSDFIVLVGVTAQQQTVVFGEHPADDWVWYDGFDEDIDDSWMFTYPPVATADVDVGTIVVEFINNLQVNPLSATIPTVWAGAGRGILDGTSNVSRVVDAINEMFRQSPYMFSGPSGR